MSLWRILLRGALVGVSSGKEMKSSSMVGLLTRISKDPACVDVMKEGVVAMRVLRMRVARRVRPRPRERHLVTRASVMLCVIDALDALDGMGGNGMVAGVAVEALV
ncbi:hypothetical protein BKA57DRAFT_446683 [Linnemannia elongata]|nr:hypothetical protein BKA57DRAFT_446683 [Linnemannia elongata]KAK5829370.1 hypothetical protein F5H01DRAFT_330053 [Linnemannia elongata]